MACKDGVGPAAMAKRQGRSCVLIHQPGDKSPLFAFYESESHLLVHDSDAYSIRGQGIGRLSGVWKIRSEERRGGLPGRCETEIGCIFAASIESYWN
jgi:hypothetical protein